MEENRRTQAELPVPKWCLVLLGIPTFTTLLVCLTILLWLMVNMSVGRIAKPSEAMRFAVDAATYMTFGLWPVYLAWVSFSSRLTRREKGLWLFAVLLGNMVAMPMFYVFMIRRYLGLEGRTGTRDEIRLDIFLRRCGVRREQLSSDQVSVLRSYCREHRMGKWLLTPMVALVAWIVYIAVVPTREKCVSVFTDLCPTHVVIIDTARESKQEMVPD